MKPVALPPGRASVSTRPSATGSEATNTIGIVVVAARAARAGGEPALDTSKVAYQLPQPTGMMPDIFSAGVLDLDGGAHRGPRRGEITPAQVSFGKLDNVRQALDVAREARSLLGANGITLEYPVIRHMNNLESVLTYEGTHEVHTLVVGGALTGTPAFR